MTTQHTYKRWLFFLAALVAIGLGIREYSLSSDQKVHLYFLSVGQGDSTLIVTPKGKRILIDGGPDWSTLESLGTHLPFLDRHIDLLVLSHPNLDHLLSFPEIMKRYSIGGLALSGTENALPRYQKMFALAGEKNIPLVTLSAGQRITIEDDVFFDVLWPPVIMPTGFSKNENNASAVLMLLYKNHRALFTGDMEKPVEETLVRAHVDLKTDILKVAHHGSRSSSSTGFLLAAKPALAVISVGKNTYGHPRAEIIERLRSIGADVQRTDQAGTIEVVW